MAEQITQKAAHRAEVKHDPESHAYDCHDDCTVSIICPGVTDDCRTWWGCLNHKHPSPEDSDWDEISAHGERHAWIDGQWMTPSEQCIGHTLDTDADEMTDTHPDGLYVVDLDCDEGFVRVIPVSPLPPERTDTDE